LRTIKRSLAFKTVRSANDLGVESAPRWEGLYEVSSHGRVRSLRRYVAFKDGRGRVQPERILKAALDRGYPTLALWRDNKQTMARVHRLVCEAFHGPAPSNEHEVAHWDGNPANAQKDNLRWATHLENETDKIAHGTLTMGERHGMVKLTEAQAREIKHSTAKGAELARQYGVTPSAVCHIRKGKLWRSLEPA